MSFDSHLALLQVSASHNGHHSTSCFHIVTKPLRDIAEFQAVDMGHVYANHTQE